MRLTRRIRKAGDTRTHNIFVLWPISIKFPDRKEIVFLERITKVQQWSEACNEWITMGYSGRYAGGK
jgi:hypothetical protein